MVSWSKESTARDANFLGHVFRTAVGFSALCPLMHVPPNPWYSLLASSTFVGYQLAAILCTCMIQTMLLLAVIIGYGVTRCYQYSFDVYWLSSRITPHNSRIAAPNSPSTWWHFFLPNDKKPIRHLLALYKLFNHPFLVCDFTCRSFSRGRGFGYSSG